MNQIAQVREQLIVILVGEVLPTEFRVAVFWTIHQQVVSPDLAWQILFQLNSMVTKYPCAVSLTEFSSLVVQVLGGRDRVEESPVPLAGNERRREDNSVEGDIVFAHELI